MSTDKKYYKISQYTMKCRLYPNKKVAEGFDKAIQAIHCYHNCLLYDIFNGNIESTAKPYKPKKESKPEKKKDESDFDYQQRLYSYEQKQKYKDGDTIHFPNLNYAFSAEYKNKLIEEHPIIANAPASAITTKIGLMSDIKKSLGKLPIEFQKPKYYSKKKPRQSFSYQDVLGKLVETDNKNVLFIKLPEKFGGTHSNPVKCKIRGWNQKIRFDGYGKINFIDYFKSNPNKRITIKIEKDNCGDYWIVFSLTNVYKPMANPQNTFGGIDVGIKDIAILSDNTKFENRRFKDEEKQHIKFLNRRLSRRQGWSNEEFRDGYKQNKDMIVSKTYQRTQLKLSKLHRKIACKRKNYNHNITTKIINTYSFIGIETLNVTGMFRNRHLSNALSDAAMGEILSMLKYKAEWYDRIIQPISQWSPSSKRCSCCGYIRPKLDLHIREWQCSKCGTIHDRDVNAAINILYYALLIYYGEEKGKEIFEKLNNNFQLLCA